MKSFKPLLALSCFILFIGVAVFFETNRHGDRQDTKGPSQTSRQDESNNQSQENSALVAESGLQDDDSLASAGANETQDLLLPSEAVGQVFPKVNLDDLASRLPAEEFAVYKRTREEFPKVDWTEIEPTHQSFLEKRAEFPLNLDDSEREAYATWIAEVEPMIRSLIRLRAEEHGLSAGGMEDSRGYYIEGFRDGEPVYIVTANVTAATTTGVSYVRWNPSFDPALADPINGDGIYMNINDHGEIYEHAEFQLPNSGGSRILVKEIPGYADGDRNHMTHVAGTMAAWGYDPNLEGMAPRAWIRSLIQQSIADITDYGMATPGQEMGIVNPRTGNPQLRSMVGNTSLGVSDPYNRYDSTSASFDTVLRDHPYYMHFYSSGNSGAQGYESLTGASKVAKNIIGVGNASAATRDADGVYTGGGDISGSSSRGPTYDGRINPDFVGKGSGVTSTVNENASATYSGTSMSSPNVAGSVALLMDYVRKRLPQEYLRSSTYRALLATTADDRGNPGPDYIYGWGILNIHAAAKIIREQAENPLSQLVIENSLAPSQTWSEDYVSDGTEPIRVTIAWLDPASPNTNADSRASRIVNDLDLRLIGPGDVEHQPYVMPFTTGQDATPAFDPSLYGAHAVAGDNITDPVEQVYLAAPQDGIYTVQVTHKGGLLDNEAQPFSVTVSGLNQNFDFPPFVMSQIPAASSQITDPISEISLNFSKPMDTTSFSIADGIVSLFGPGGDLKSAISSHSWSADNTTLTLAFPAQSALGPYTLVLASQIQSVEGEFLNQNRNQIPGEIIEDRYIGTFELVQPPIYYAGMDTDPGWTLGTSWAFGQPSDTNQDNSGLPGPTAGYNGPNVIGFSLVGDYESNIGETRWATTPAIDCSGRENVTLSFQRWLGVERSQYDRAFLQASNNGTAWTTVWENPNSHIDDNGWGNVEYDISAVADGQSTVFVRWGLGPTDGSMQYYGWNLDEVLIDADMIISPDPEIAINRGGTPIYPGGTDGVGGTFVGVATQVTYSISNLGGAGLTLSTPVTATAVSNCSITVDTQPSGTVATSAGTDMALTITPSTAGAWSATVSVASNDADENPFTWTMNGYALDSYVITYDGNASDSGTAPVDANNPHFEGSSVTVLDNTGNLTKSGFSFAGWNTAANGSGTSYQPDATFFMPGADVTLYAVWNAPPVVNAGPDQNIFLAASSWSPITLNPGLWLDAADSDTITLNGSTVSQWDDKSGFNRHASQSSSGSQPTYAATGLNDKGVVTFDGSDDLFSVDLDFLAGVSHSAFIVTKPTTYSNIYGAANGNQASNSLHVGFSSSTGYRMNFWSNDFNRAISANFVAGQANLVNYIWNTGVDKQILANGKSEGSNTNAGNIGTMSGGGRIGRTTGHPFFGGDIAEILIITGEITTESRQEIEGYLAHKWGLAVNLPNDHPYKASPPDGAAATTTLASSASDPEGDPLTTQWSLQNGPAGVSFDDVAATNSNVTFMQEGIYTLRQTAADDFGSAFDEVNITVGPAPPERTLTYYGNENTGGTAPVDPQSPYQENNMVTVLGPGDLLKTGYTFAGWNTASDGTGTGYAPSSSFTISADTSLYAQWTANTDGYTLSKSSATVGEAGGTDSFSVVLDTQPTSDVVFDVTSSSTAEVTVSPSSLTFTSSNWSISQNVTMTGVDDSTTSDDTATVTVSVNAAASMDAYDLLSDQTVSVTCTNDDFPGITVGAISGVTGEDGTTATFSVVLNTLPVADVTIGLSPSDTGEGTVSPASLTFISGDWNTPQTVTVTGADDALLDGDVVYSVVTGAASSADADYNGIDPADVSVTNLDNESVVSYDGNGSDGGSAPADQVKIHGTALTLSDAGTLTRTGYTFSGWNTALDGSGVSYATGASYNDEADLTLYAQWTIDTYTVSYEGNGNTGGTAPADQTKTYNLDLTLETVGNLVRDGYVFAGWNTSADGTGTDYAEGATYSTDADITLYAKWLLATPPVITSLDPADNATDVAANSDLIVTFDENIAIGTGNITIKNLTDVTQTVIDVTDGTQSSISGSTLTINPTDDLLLGKDYAVQIDEGAITDLIGSPFAGMNDDTTWNFQIIVETLIFSESFEDPDVINDGRTDPTGWDTVGHVNYVHISDENDTAPDFTSTSYGSQALTCYNGSDAYAQTSASILSETVSVGSRYILSFNVAALPGRSDAYYTATLLAIDGGGVETVLGTVSGNNDGTSDMSYSNSLEVTPTTNAGERLAIRLRHTVSAPWQDKPTFDNVQLKIAGGYSVTYNGNGSDGGTVPDDSSSYAENDTVTVLGNTGSLTKTGYTFSGWNTAADGSGTGYVANDTFTIIDNVTLYAQWNRAPVANDQSTSTVRDNAVSITLTASDADGDTLSYAVTTQPTNGTLTGTAPGLTYNPSSGFAGSDSFTFTANDGTVDSNTATVSITVQPPFENWASGGNSPSGDSNGDGISDGLAWVLGATDPSSDATAMLPEIDVNSDPNYYMFTYRRNDEAHVDSGTTINVIYGDDMSTWSTATHDGSSIVITESDDYYGSGVDRVVVRISWDMVTNDKIFTRLRIEITP